MRALKAFLLPVLALAVVSLTCQQSAAKPGQPLPALTASGSAPFHLQAVITINGGEQKIAELEIFWVAPDRYRRVVKGAGFNQTLVVNGAAVFDQHSSEYLPADLGLLIAAVVDPRPLEDLTAEIARLKPPPPPRQSPPLVLGSMSCSKVSCVRFVCDDDGCGPGGQPESWRRWPRSGLFSLQRLSWTTHCPKARNPRGNGAAYAALARSDHAGGPEIRR